MYSTSPKPFALFCIMPGFVFMMYVLASCNGNSTTVSPSSSTTKLVVINASPDVGPIQAYINTYVLGITTGTSAQRTYFRYSTTPVYYSIGTGLLTLQLRTENSKIQYSSDTVTTVSNRGYSLFMVGLAAKDSITSLLVKDDPTPPALGKGRMRFINVSPRTQGMDVYVNGALGFTKIAYKGISPYIELPAGIYDFKMTATGSAANGLADLPRITIQDGKVYTLYSKGMVGRIDTAAIGLNIITNK